MTSPVTTLPNPRTRLSGEDRQRQIVETLLQLVAERGAQAVSAQAIAERIGISQPAIFRHFPTMKALWLAVMDWLDERLDEILSASARAPDATPLSRLRATFMAHARMVERHPALPKIVFNDQLRLEFVGMQQGFTRIHENYRCRIALLIEQAIGNGSALVSPTDGATLFLSMIQGLSFQFAIARRPMKLQEEAKALYALFERAIGAKAD